jgi:hypothetical protein
MVWQQGATEHRTAPWKVRKARAEATFAYQLLGASAVHSWVRAGEANVVLRVFWALHAAGRVRTAQFIYLVCPMRRREGVRYIPLLD